MSNNRIRRVESLIQTELATLIHNEIDDPKLQWLTVTGVRVSADLSYAKVYVVFHDEIDAEPKIDLLNQYVKPMRYQLSKIVKLRKTPELQFFYDYSISEGNRIDALLKEALEKSEK